MCGLECAQADAQLGERGFVSASLLFPFKNENSPLLAVLFFGDIAWFLVN